jgi:holliday junction DNA helicase RuvA
MISYLEGSIKHKGPNFLIIQTGGVGYKVFAPLDILGRANSNDKFSLFIYTNVRDDAIELYGFNNSDDLSLFELFLGVSGIGPKTAMAIFSNAKVPKIKEAIVKGDVDFFSTIPRLGRKNAQKIIIELRSKLGSLEDLDLTPDSGENKEIIDALKAFGFSTNEAREAFKSIRDMEGSASDKIKQALKYLGKK